jgi:hypothetical protein
MYLGTSDTRYLTVERAARILRVNPATIYRNLHEVPHLRNGNLIVIPCEWLFMEPPPIPVSGRRYVTPEPWFEQLELPIEIKPVRRWRNNGRPVVLDPFGDVPANMYP